MKMESLFQLADGRPEALNCNMKSIWMMLLFGSMSVACAEKKDATNPLVAAARSQVGVTVSYEPSYVSMEYPGGDVPIEAVFGMYSA